MKPFKLIAVLGLTMILAAGWRSSVAGQLRAGSQTNPVVSVNKADYPVFPAADSGADPSVSAEQGGKGFTGKGWETNTGFDLIGDPHAVKGGLFREYMTDFPSNLRLVGPEARNFYTGMINSVLYETLLRIDPTTLELAPELATHWQISPDKLTYRFRLNPNARFSDGSPVTADDVVASWSLYTDKSAQDPAYSGEFGAFEKPVAESKYIVRVKAKSSGWLDFDNFATELRIVPAKALKGVDGAAYVRDYNYKPLPGTGPYAVADADIHKGESISIRRRKDYWADRSRAGVGLNNFDEVRLVVVRDPNLAFEMFKKGDLDFYYVNRSRDWIEQLNFDAVQRGLIQKRKVFNNLPKGYLGYAMNTQRAPFDDIRVRKAFTLLENRAVILDKIFFNEYLPDNSYYPGGVYENPNDPKNLYDPSAAVKLLNDAGWTGHDSEGRLTKQGKPLSVELLYFDKQAEPYLSIYQEDLRKAGITLNLRFVTYETQMKLVSGDRNFEMSMQAWTARVFPDPEKEFGSKLADAKNNDNITAFKEPRVDEIIGKYQAAFDVKKRIAMLQEIDGILTGAYHYVLGWYAPNRRIIYWNRFGMPQGIFTRTGDRANTLENGPGPEQLWWVDSDKAQKLDQAVKNPSMKLDLGQTENRYWLNYGKK